MNVPMNETDYQRFLKLAEAIRQEPSTNLKIYISDNYVSIEATCRNIDRAALDSIFNH